MNIVYIHQYFETPDQFGGLRSYQNSLHMINQGHRVTMITGSGNYHSSDSRKRFEKRLVQRENIHGIDVIWVDTVFQYHKTFLHRVLGFLVFMLLSTWVGLRQKADVVYVTSPPLTVVIPGFVISLFKRCPLAFEVRDIWPESAVTAGVLKNPVLIRVAEFLERFAYRAACRIVPVSEGIRDSLVERGFDRDKMRVVRHGADLGYLTPDKADGSFRRKYGLEGKFVAIYAGSFGNANGIDMLVKAAHILRDHESVSIVLLGDGKEKEQLVSMAEEYRLTNLVFADPVPKKEVAAAIGAADAGLMILRNAPTFKTVLPNKLLDYMACELPVIINFEGYASNIVTGAGAGLVVSPDSPEAIAAAIEQLSRDRASCAAMGASGRETVVRDYSRNATVRDFERVIHEMV